MSERPPKMIVTKIGVDGLQQLHADGCDGAISTPTAQAATRGEFAPQPVSSAAPN